MRVAGAVSTRQTPAIVAVVGARPQFIKAVPVSRALRASGLREVLIHTGQHYDIDMSDVFFERLGLPGPTHHLAVGSAPHGAQTGRMLERLESVLVNERPAVVIVYGDTNSTLAGALAAAKLNIPVAHVEAGLRSFDRKMPEEVNRILTDRISQLLFAPTQAAVTNLASEGIVQGVHQTGDVMYDTARLFRSEVGELASDIPKRFGVTPGAFVFTTVHRAENTDDPERWHSILDAVSCVGREVAPVLWPVHPRVRDRLRDVSIPSVTLLEPLPYFETQALVMQARVVLTDSGGLQKEAAFHETPCVTLRDTTEWVELLEHGVNSLAGVDPETVVRMAKTAHWRRDGLPLQLYGDGRSADMIVRVIQDFAKLSGSCL